MRLPFHVTLLATCLIVAAQGRGTVSDLVAQVRAELRRNRGDGRVARTVSKVQLSERLDDRTIEILQSEGAGPETVAELQALRDESARWPRPAKPAIPEPPAPSAAERVRIWDATHDNAVSYTRGLPDFICGEVIHRYLDTSGKGKWKLQDTLSLKLSYFDKQEEYNLVTINNHPTGLSYDQVRGAITEGEFGSMLAAIFALKSRTNRDWDHWTLVRSRPTHVFTFAIARANSEYAVTSGSSLRNEVSVKAGQHGYVYIDDATKMVVRLKVISDDFPVGFDVRRVDILVDYDFTDVGGKKYLLPLHSAMTLEAPPFRHRNETEFLQYRKFSTETTITFEGKK